jgi:hypothetical protein
MGAVTSVTQQGKPLGDHASVDALGRSRILAHIIKRMVSRSFATFLLCGVYGEAVEQEDDNCFGVARSHGFAFPCAIRQPMENIALARSPSSRFFEQQVGRIINPALKLKPLYVPNSSGSFAIRGISQSERVRPEQARPIRSETRARLVASIARGVIGLMNSSLIQRQVRTASPCEKTAARERST